ncbi:MAG: rhamnulokinase, partial [Acholeplasmataceae bacterium]|nr:rhamnulokinase [Acholeplasmataceae bacterium]
ARLYQETGIQYLHFNTLYQLKKDASLLKKTDKILLMPDLIAYYLTGTMRMELTNLSTTNLYNLHTRSMIDLENIGIPKRVFPDMIYPEEAYGLIKKDLASELSIPRVPVIAVCTHDTASAVFSIPDEDDYIYISSGTWSLCGVLLDKPVTTLHAREENYTNEIGYGHQTRFLKNVMGLWIINQCLEEWHHQRNNISYAQIASCAEKAEYAGFIDPDAPLFESPGAMVGRIKEYCRNTGQREPQTIGEIALTIYQSLAYKYRFVFETLEMILGRNYKKIVIVSGGSNISLLNQLTASVCAKTVSTGAQEATILGNALVLMKATKTIKTLAEGRDLIRKSISEKIYLSEDKMNLDAEYRRFCRIIKGVI